MNPLLWLVGKDLRNVIQREHDWLFEFGGETSVVVFCLWRLRNGGRIRLTCLDDGQQFGLPSPVVAETKLNSELRRATVTAVDLDEGSLDCPIISTQVSLTDARERRLVRDMTGKVTGVPSRDPCRSPGLATQISEMATAERIAELYRSGAINADDVRHHQYKSAHPMAFRLRKRSAAWRRRALQQLRRHSGAGVVTAKATIAPLLPADGHLSVPRWLLLLLSPFAFVAAVWHFSQTLVCSFVFIATSTLSHLTELHWRRFRVR